MKNAFESRLTIHMRISYHRNYLINLELVPDAPPSSLETKNYFILNFNPYNFIQYVEIYFDEKTSLYITSNNIHSNHHLSCERSCILNNSFHIRTHSNFEYYNLIYSFLVMAEHIIQKTLYFSSIWILNPTQHHQPAYEHQFESEIILKNSFKY